MAGTRESGLGSPGRVLLYVPLTCTHIRRPLWSSRIHPLTHPSFRHVKRYEVAVQGYPTEEALEQINAGGFVLPGEAAPLLGCKVGFIDTDRASGLSLMDVTLEESRPQQIQLTMEALGCPVISMKVRESRVWCVLAACLD